MKFKGLSHEKVFEDLFVNFLFFKYQQNPFELFEHCGRSKIRNISSGIETWLLIHCIVVVAYQYLGIFKIDVNTWHYNFIMIS